mmetsp:Transcript_19098/g.50660  ORF Transcript_19098/g.50660 Transcript_19098/m.50660 type:complete len:262 (-) Transcript_19098:786-1571(-)
MSQLLTSTVASKSSNLVRNRRRSDGRGLSSFTTSSDTGCENERLRACRNRRDLNVLEKPNESGPSPSTGCSAALSDATMSDSAPENSRTLSTVRPDLGMDNRRRNAMLIVRTSVEPSAGTTFWNSQVPFVLPDTTATNSAGKSFDSSADFVLLEASTVVSSATPLVEVSMACTGIEGSPKQNAPNSAMLGTPDEASTVSGTPYGLSKAMTELSLHSMLGTVFAEFSSAAAACLATTAGFEWTSLTLGASMPFGKPTSVKLG